jgi:CubicO group peptidase (beta-lactamase class C family)
MKRHSIAIAAGLLWGSTIPGAAEDSFPGAAWEHVAPEAAGWSTERIKQAEEWSQHIGSMAVMVIHHGAIVAEWGDTAAKTPLASVRKSLLSALIGNAVERGEITLSQPIGALGINDNEPSLSDEEKTATVRDLLEARSGIYHAALYETAAMAARRPPRFSHKPGGPSGTTIIGISTASGRSTSTRRARRSSTPSSARSLGRSACRIISLPTANMSPAQRRSIRRTLSR